MYSVWIAVTALVCPHLGQTSTTFESRGERCAFLRLTCLFEGTYVS